MPMVPDAGNRHPGYLAAPHAPDPQPCALGPPELPQTLPWPGPPLRMGRMIAFGTPSNASSMRGRVPPTTLSPTRPDCPRVTVNSPYVGMSVSHLVDTDSPRVTVNSPLIGMSAPHLVNAYSPRVIVNSPVPGMSVSHLVDVYSPRVTQVVPVPGVPESHLANVDRSLYYLTTIT